jgi:hypothetical protein
VYLIAALVIIVSWSGLRLIQTNRAHREQLQQLKTQREQILKESEEAKSSNSNLKKQLEAKDQEIKNLKQSKAIVKTAYASSRVTSQSITTEAQARAWIIAHEGGATSVNKSSLACGAPQSLPCSKILSFAGVDMSKYNLNTYEGVKAAISTVPLSTQLAWMDRYVAGRYGSYLKAYQFKLKTGWY